MLLNVLVVLALAFLTAPVFGQMIPPTLPIPPYQPILPCPPILPGQPMSPQGETSHLKSLVKAQQRRISLLEEKIKLLEKELQNQGGASK